MNRIMRSVMLFALLLLALALAGGCGGGGGSSLADRITGNDNGGLVGIGDPQPGQTITSPEPGQRALDDGTMNFNSGNYANAVYEFERAVALAETPERRAKAYEGLAWSMAKNGMAIGDASTGSVILTFEKIGESTLLDWSNQTINDARAGLAFAYMSRNASGDVAKAAELIKRIAPDLSNPAAPAANPYFAYLPERANGITNGMMHALYAYCQFLLGNTALAKQQIEYAYQREPNGAFVKEMRTNLTLLGLFN